jgi:hypothetical protein
MIGDLLYRLNVNPPVVRMMARGHVYSDPAWLTGERLTEKMAVVSAPGARFASVRFVTGMLDLLQDRSSFLETARRVKDPILVIYGAETPRRSKAEIEALEAVPLRSTKRTAARHSDWRVSATMLARFSGL